MKKHIYKFLLTAFLSALGLWVQAQDKSALQFGADIMSRYIWRGIDLGGPGLSLQPTMSYSLFSKDSTHCLKFGAWGAYTFSPTANQEADVFAVYTFNDILSFTITDYFFPDLNLGYRNSYFNYKKGKTGHVFEGMVSFNGTEKIPFTLLFAMNFYGNDATKSNGDIFMSNYLEAGYKTSCQGYDYTFFAGATLNDPDEKAGEMGYYLNKKPNLINLGIKASKNIKISSDYSLPVQCSLIANPEAERFYIVFGFTL